MGTKQKARASSSLGVKQIMPRGELWGKARAKQKARATNWFVEGHALSSSLGVKQIMARGELWGKARAKQKARATAFVEGHAVV